MTMDLSTWEWISRLAVAAALSGVIGIEREARHKAAGLRTHMLVSMGSALFTLVGVESLAAADTSRMAAGVVTGVGFLGAGAIFRAGYSVQGLTTAAGLWVAAAIGVVAGAGELVAAVVATALAVITLNGMSLVERQLQRRADQRAARLVVHLISPRPLGDAMSLVSSVDNGARECDVVVADDGSVNATFLVRRAHASTVQALVTGLEGVAYVEEVTDG